MAVEEIFFYVIHNHKEQEEERVSQRERD